MSKREFEQIINDEPFVPIGRRAKDHYGKIKEVRKSAVLNQAGHNLGCCDCGLVHSFDFSIVQLVGGKNDGKFAVRLKGRRNEAATRRLRKQQGRRVK